jgi:TP901 family phage tail tape measure protein
MPDVKYLISLQDKFSGRMKTADRSVNRFNKSLGRTIGRFATFAAAGAVIGGSIKKMADFEEQVSNLSAITGAAGEDLDFLKRKAIELGKATTKSSIDTVKAFKLIASAKPELLENSKALAAVTKEAITLSEASGLELPTAATALTDALNQFGLAADQSSRVINILAAGSKFAAAEIPDLTMSLKEFGGVAESLGISIEESAAAVETLSAKGLKGQRAGIQMRNVLLKLGASTDKKVNPKIVGLSIALDNLADIQDDTSKLTKMFGRQNVLAAQTLIKQRDRVDELTESMTGTNVAYEQARINTDNLNSDVKRLSSAWEGLVLGFNKGEGVITNVFRKSVLWATRLLEMMDKLNQGESLRLQRMKNMNKEAATALTAGLSTRIAEVAAKKGITAEEQRLELIEKTREKVARYEKEIAAEQHKIEKMKVMQGLSPFAGIRRGKAKGRRTELEYHRDLALETMRALEELGGAADDILGGDGTGLGETGLGDQETKITSTAPKVFNINIEKFVENFAVNSETINEAAPEVRERMVEMWIRMLAEVQTAGAA